MPYTRRTALRVRRMRSKLDDRGYTVDVHALRHTFGTHLAKGVLPRTAQAAMRHSTIQLTMNLYTDPRLLDVASALHSLPQLMHHRSTRAVAGA
jgi:integrase